MKEELKQYRKKMFLIAYPLKTAHLASAFSIAEVVYALYKKGIMKYDVNNPQWKDRDRFILSKGHASLAVYAILNEIGVLSDEKINSFCRPNTNNMLSIGGEVNPADAPGIEAATGSLGHGLGLGVGQAIALKMDKSPAHVYVIVGNGEINEGVIWESVMSAYKFGLDNLTVVLDDNKVQKMGYTSDTMRISSWEDKWRAFGWTVDIIKDGNDIDEVVEVLSRPNAANKPRVIISNTIKGKGVSYIEGDPDWHFRMPKKKELKYFMEDLGITEEELKNAESIFNGVM